MTWTIHVNGAERPVSTGDHVMLQRWGAGGTGISRRCRILGGKVNTRGNVSLCLVVVSPDGMPLLRHPQTFWAAGGFSEVIPQQTKGVSGDL